MQQQHYDVIIGGGAMNGLTLALALNTFSASKLRIAVIEQAFVGINDIYIADGHHRCASSEITNTR